MRVRKEPQSRRISVRIPRVSRVLYALTLDSGDTNDEIKAGAMKEETRLMAEESHPKTRVHKHKQSPQVLDS